MKRLLAIILSLIMVAGVLPAMGIAVSAAAYSGTVATAFSAGAGTEASPYEIGTAEELYYFASLVNKGTTSIHAKLTANIVVNENVLTDDGSLNGTPTYTWTPIGNSTNQYKGTFEGAGYSVSGLYFDDSKTGCVGLFGYVGKGGKVQNVGVVDSYFCGFYSVGGVVGDNEGTVTSCYNTGTIYNRHGLNIGGVAGKNKGTLTNCYNTGTVSGSSQIGGVVGYNDSNGTVKNCCNTGTVSGNYDIGGVAGYNYGTLTSCCYLSGCVKSDDGTGYGIGGTTADTAGSTTGVSMEEVANGTACALVGYHLLGEYRDSGNGTHSVACSACNVEEEQHSYADGECTRCGAECKHANTTSAWTDNKDSTHSLRCSACGEALETEEHSYEDGKCTDCRGYESAEMNGDGYYEISNAGQLYWFADMVNGVDAGINGILTANIVVNENVLADDGRLNTGTFEEWTPIGKYANRYTGIFEGAGYSVSGLYFNDSTTDAVGLFGDVGRGGKVQNVGVVDSYFCGFYDVGGVAGYNYGTLTNCYNTGTVSGSFDIGGVVGYNDCGTVESCYSTGSVTGNNYVGGVVSYNYGGTVENCYSIGELSGSAYVGGVVGSNCSDTTFDPVPVTMAATIKNCYYNKDVFSGDAVGYDYDGSTEKVEGKTTAEFSNGTVCELVGYHAYNIYSDNGNGAHSVACFVCSEPFETEEHSYEDSECTKCGAECRHSYDSATGLCADCGAQAMAKVERVVSYDGDVYYESEYFDALSDVLDYCRNAGDGEYTPDSAEIILYTDLTIAEGEKVTIPANTTLNLNGNVVTNNGKLTLPEGYSLTEEFITGGQVVVGDRSYTWDSEKSKYICDEGSHSYDSATGFCTDCGGYESAKVVDESNREEFGFTDEAYDGYYAIGNLGQLMWFKENAVSGKHSVILTNDITIDNSVVWQPMTLTDGSGNSSIFDGGGHSIIFENTREESTFGLFGTYNYSFIKNLYLEGSITCYSTGNVGVLVNSAYRTTISNVISTCSITNSATEGGTGGLAGRFGGQDSNGLYSLIENCAVYADVKGGGSAGGFIGNIWSGYQYCTVRNSAYMGDVAGAVNSGAVAGYNSNNSSATSTFSDIYYCEADGSGWIGNGGSGKASITNMEKKSEDAFKSGEVTYLLNKGVTDGSQVWYQTIGEADYPQFSGKTVYLEDGIYYNEKISVTLDGVVTETDGYIVLGTDNEDGTYSLPENVVGYYFDDSFVDAGKYAVSGGEVITTVDFNVTMLNGAQVRFGGGLDENGKINAGNGLRFIATVDRSGFDGEGYGMRITAEGSTAYTEVDAEFWQDDTTFSVAITDMAVTNYNRNFTATPYVKVKYDDGSEKTVYGTQTVTRSIYYVATGLLKNGGDEEYGVSGYYGLQEVLNAYVNMVGVRLMLYANGTVTASDKYTGEVFFDVTSVDNGDGSYTITVTPVTEGFAYPVSIMEYWDEFVRINNNNSVVVKNISDSKLEDGVLTFTFTVPKG